MRPVAGGSLRAVRTHSAEMGQGATYYLTYVWACLVCGREWLDGSLERLNAWAAYTATLSAKGRDDSIIATSSTSTSRRPKDLVASCPQG